MEKSRPRQIIRLGILVPSSNTALEPLTQSIITPSTTPTPAGTGEGISNDRSSSSSSSSWPPVITLHFSRFPMTEISLSNKSLTQFTHDKILAAAQLLADAAVDVIGWSGTSAGWLGFQHDTELCELITRQTGIPATSSVVALNQLLARLDVSNLGLVTPYLQEVNDKIVANYRALGVTVTAPQQALAIVDNHDIARVSDDVLDRLVGLVVKEMTAREGEDGDKGVKEGEHDKDMADADRKHHKPHLTVLTTFCTNLTAAQRVPHWENLHGIVVLDTVSTVVWGMLHLLDLDTSFIQGWGKMFDIK